MGKRRLNVKKIAAPEKRGAGLAEGNQGIGKCSATSLNIRGSLPVVGAMGVIRANVRAIQVE